MISYLTLKEKIKYFLSLKKKNLKKQKWRSDSALRTFFDLAEGLNLVPSTHVGQLTTTYNSTAKVSDALSWPLWTPTQRCTYMNMETNTYTEANKKMESNSKPLILVVIDLHGSGAKTDEVTADLQFTVYWDQLLQNAQ